MSLQRSLLPLHRSAEFSSSSSSGCVEQSFTEGDKSHLELQPWGPNMAPANTTESHTHTQKHTLVPACPKMLFCGGTKGGVCCSYLTHSYIREFSNTKCTVVSVMQGTAFTWLAKAGKESLYFQNPSH